MMKIHRKINRCYFVFAVEKYTPLMHRLAYKISHDQSHVDVLINIARSELLKCMMCYDKSLGSFLTFYYDRIYNIFRHEKTAAIKCGIVFSATTKQIASISDIGYNRDESSVIQDCFECLTEDEKEIISSLYFGRKTLREIGCQFGIAHSTVSNIKKRAIRKMKIICGV